MYKRTWIITGEITRDDIEWVLRSKLSFIQGEQHYLDFASPGSSVLKKVPTLLEPSTIITTDEKEETWLKLYFVDRAILLAEEVMYKYDSI
jgi:hypothetical protein